MTQNVDLAETFGSRLSRLRKEKDLSQEQFAEIMDVSRQSISKWENNNAYPEMTKLIFMSKYFETSLDNLILGNEEAVKNCGEKKSIGKIEALLLAINSFISNLSSWQKTIVVIFGITAVLICFAIIYWGGYVAGKALYYLLQ